LTGRPLSTGISTLSFLSVKEHIRKTGMPEDSKFILLLDICNALSREFELWLGSILFFTSSKYDNLWTKKLYNTWSVIIGKVSFTSLRITKEQSKTFNALHYQRCRFQHSQCIEFSEGQTVCQAWMKL
jgi:hypothetical protein